MQNFLGHDYIPYMPSTNNILTILFADISGSTTLYEILSNETAHGIIDDCLSMLSITVRLHDGKIIKTRGDGIMCSFHDAADAADAAMAMNQVIDQIVDRKAKGENSTYMKSSGRKAIEQSL